MYNRHDGDKMKSILVEINCTACFYQTHKKSETLVLPDFEPDARKDLVEGRFFSCRCPRCGKTINFLHPCIYADKEHHFILLIKPEMEVKESDYTMYEEDQISKKRLVTKIDDVAEKIRIFEDGFDDHTIEVLKAKLLIRARNKGENIAGIAYLDYDKASATLWFQYSGEGNVVGIAHSVYARIQKEIPMTNATGFVEVNISWGIQYHAKC